MRFHKNLGPLDRTLRFGLSAIFMYFGFFNRAVITDPLAGALLGGSGAVLFIIAAIAWCPFYQLIDFNTLNEKS
jgi:uncharacterized MAPEG superfamily protein